MRCPSLTEILALSLPAAAAICMGCFLVSGLPSGEAANISRARDDLRALRSALLINEALPTTETGLLPLVASGTIAFLPQDPWGHQYQYRNPGKAYQYELFSLGPDGVESGDDIDIWHLYGSGNSSKRQAKLK